MGPLDAMALIMAILNVTPDSFSGDGIASATDAAKRALALEAEGADILDIGGESTRPGSLPVDEDEEMRRVVPAVRAIRDAGVLIPISIDTRHASVADACLSIGGVSIINDVSGFGSDARMAAVVRDHGAECVLMHGYDAHMAGRGSGSPEDGPDAVDRFMRDVLDSLKAMAESAMAAGIDRERIILDPGFGFGKEVWENMALLDHLDEVVALGHPVLVGLSRKRFVGAVSGVMGVKQRDDASAHLAAIAVAKGASIIRVHDVGATRKALASPA